MIYHGRGISAAGSAPRWQRGGHGFEPRMLHLESTVFAVLFLIRVVFRVAYGIILRYILSE